MCVSTLERTLLEFIECAEFSNELPSESGRKESDGEIVKKDLESHSSKSIVKDLWGPKASLGFLSSMGEVFQSARAFVKNVTELFGETDGQRSKCPRCKGSGLFASQSFWRWGQPPRTNSPCWFCEGVGVMPVVGLNGYMIGRSNSVLHTGEIKKRQCMPVNTQLCLGKFPGSKCKLTTYKPADDITEMLYDPVYCPDWLNAADTEAVLNKTFHVETERHEELEKFQSWTLMSPERVNSSFQHRFYARTSGPFSTLKVSASIRPAQPPSTLLEPLTSALSLDGITSTRKEGRRPFSARHSSPDGLHEVVPTRLRTAEGEDPSSHENSQPKNDRARLPRQSRSQVRDAHPVQAGQSVTADTVRTDLIGNESTISGKPMLNSRRGHKSPRRPRNRVREEAGRQAEDRARRVQQPITQRSKEETIILADPLVESLLFDDSTNQDEYNNFLGTGEKSAQSRVSWPLGSSSTRRLSAELSFMNKILYRRAKVNLSCSPTLAKAF